MQACENEQFLGDIAIAIYVANCKSNIILFAIIGKVEGFKDFYS